MTIDPQWILAAVGVLGAAGAFIVWALNFQRRMDNALSAKIGREEHQKSEQRLLNELAAIDVKLDSKIGREDHRQSEQRLLHELTAMNAKLDANERYSVRYRENVQAELRENAIDLALIQRDLEMRRRRRTGLLSGQSDDDGKQTPL